MTAFDRLGGPPGAAECMYIVLPSPDNEGPGSQPLAGASGSQPLAGGSGSQPLAEATGSQPMAGASGSQPLAG